jgi:hypothetical protein
MPSHGRLAVLALSFALSVFNASGEKRWQVKVQEPAILGDSIAGARVVFGPVTGRCASEFTELLSQDMLAHGVIVIPPDEVAAAAARHNVQATAPPEARAHPELAKVLGPSVLVTAEIARCEARPREALRGPGLPAIHISRTEGYLNASVRVLDLASGEELAALAIRANPGKQNEAQSAPPEYPSAPELLATALRQGVTDASRLYTSWVDSREFSFMDDKDCNLKEAFALLQSRHYDGLVRVSRRNAESCTANPKVQAAAWYNLGVSYLLVGNDSGAHAALVRAQALKDNRQIAEALSLCTKKKARSEVLARRILAWVRQIQTEKAPEGQVRTGILFTNELVIRLVQGNVADENIIGLIASQPSRFVLGANELLKLKQAGVSDAVINAMQEPRTK